MMANSYEIEKRFPEVYKEFYLKNNIVLSGTNVMNWVPGFTRGIESCKIVQKVPNKCFCGIQEITENKVIIDEVWVFMQHGFERYKFHEIESTIKSVEDFIVNFLAKENYTKGVAFNFLSEKPKGNGFSCFSDYAVLIATGLYLITNQIDDRLLKNYKKFFKSDIFDKILKTSNQISELFNGIKTVGANYCIMSQEKFPIVYFPSKYKEEKEENKYYGQTLSDISGLKTNPEKLPFDYGIIFFGRNHSWDEMKSIYQNVHNEYNEIFNDFAPKTLGIRSEKLYEYNFTKFLLQMIDMTLFRFIKVFQTLMGNMFETENINKLIQAVNEQGMLGVSFEKDFKLYMKIHSMFDSLKRFPEEELGLLPYTIGRYGGSFLFTSKYNISRDTINSMIEKFKEMGYKDIYLDYASRRDGYSSDGVILEQYLSKNIYSSYVSKNHIIYWDNSSKISLGTYTDLTEAYKEGILLDKIKRKIYVNGELISSKFLHSQSATIDILEYLLKNEDHELINLFFPISSYVKNKNEFLTKIISPFQKLVEDNFGNTFNIECYGGVKTFYIKFENNPNIKLGVIDYVTKDE